MSMTSVKSVDPRSPAHRAGVRAGETLTHINGHPIVDVLDYKFYGYDPRLELTLRDPDGTVRTLRVRKSEGEDLGLEFETYLMDRARSCANHCLPACGPPSTSRTMTPGCLFSWATTSL